MSRDRQGERVRSWPSRLLPVAIALAVGLGSAHLLAQGTRLPQHEGTTMLPLSLAEVSEEFGPRAPWAIRVVLVIVGLAIWHTTQRMLGGRQPASVEDAERTARFLSEHDGLLRLTEPANRFLNDHPRWANALLLVSSLLIDGLGLFLFVSSMVGPSIRPFLGLCILFGLRQVCQVLTALPPPPGSIWRSPGFPSLFVTYGISNDLFFSGHTALAVYGAVELAGLGSSWLMGLAIVIAIFETMAVLLLRVHYTMDIFAGFMAALYVAGMAAWLASPCDRVLAYTFAGSG